ncbi:ATR-interacting protein isoform X4 [Trachemys scripta elegans]|uniref:ATR-interacting protein isoform X4 n=1 Tax=Trachemys scripta elegans TaxID=31138 RepID=UPI001554822A|nr:ATR-interacting protein isoform X4 [Trachemys scripta elegans]
MARRTPAPSLAFASTVSLFWHPSELQECFCLVCLIWHQSGLRLEIIGVSSKPVIVGKYLYRMSVNSLFGNKKRNSSILYDVDQAQIMASSSVYRESTSRGCIGNHGDGFPPNKRYKSFESKSKQTEDSFGDNDDFTADDLEEIDIIASQALSQVLDSNTLSRTTHVQKPEQNARPSLTPNNTNQKSLNIEQRSVASSAERNMKEQFDSKIPCPEIELVKQELLERNVSYSFVQRQNTQGSVLLNALMKQPIAPGSLLGLCHLLSSNSEVLSGSVLQPNFFNTGSTGISSIRTTYSQDGTPSSLAALREAQKLAITGLNLIAMDEGSSKGDLTESERGLFLLKRFKIPGAVHLLPLVEYHISAYCQALQLSAKSRNSPENQSVSSSRTNSSIISSTEDFRSTLQETTITSLGVLYYLVYYSWDVVYILLSSEVKSVSEMEKNMVCNHQSDGKKENSRPQGQTVEPQDAANNDQSQHSLFKKLLQLLALSSTATGSQTNSIMNQSLKVLVKLAENSTVELLMSFWHLLTSQMLLRCVCPETPLSAVHLTVRLLAMLIHHQKLAAQLCCHSESCRLLALYMYITSRPDKSASERLWLQLEQETVRFLTKCVRCSSPSVLLLGTDCQCSLEVVKALIIMLHRQWVKVRRSESNLSAYRERIVQFLRDTVLLLHSLSQKDKLFHEHCLEVLHQYDEAMPGVRAILKKTLNLKASEELALDELYPPEPEVDDQEMDCS